MTDPSVERRFSIGASRYEAYAHVQRLTAADLLAFTLEAASGARVARILEPGCGTGLYTRMLLDAFPGAPIDGVDISEAMIRLARERTADPRARFARADAEEIVAGRYDLVTSNATFQWFLAFGRTVRRLAALLPDIGRGEQVRSVGERRYVGDGRVDNDGRVPCAGIDGIEDARITAVTVNAVVGVGKCIVVEDAVQVDAFIAVYGVDVGGGIVRDESMHLVADLDQQAVGPVGKTGRP